MKWVKVFRVARQARKAVKIARELSGDDMLGYVGLQRKRTFADYAVPALGFFAAGLAAGTGIGLLIAPTPGRELRHQIGTRYQNARNRIGAATEHLQDKVVSVEEGYPSDINDTVQQEQQTGVPVKGSTLM